MIRLLSLLFVCVFIFNKECVNSLSLTNNNANVEYFIFDTDMGTDDAWALQMILKAEKVIKNVKVLAITTVAGNTDPINAIKNTYRILDELNRTDVNVIEFYGSDSSIVIGINAFFCCYFRFHFIKALL